MFLAVDVDYREDPSSQGLCGHAAGVLFNSPADDIPASTQTAMVANISAYVPGEFYRRELPCILAILAKLSAPPDIIIVDGYVDLDIHPGLGRRLFAELKEQIAVIGVAKTAYAGAPSVPALRGGSQKPLFVTAAGIAAEEAAHIVKTMHGPHRIPTLLTWVDQMARGLR